MNTEPQSIEWKLYFKDYDGLIKYVVNLKTETLNLIKRAEEEREAAPLEKKMHEAQDEDLRQEEEERRRQREREDQEDQNIKNIQNEIKSHVHLEEGAAEGAAEGDEIAEYLKNNIDNNMLTRWQHALTTVNKLKLDVVNEVIYEELFPDHAVEGGKRILDDDGWSSDDDGWSSDDDD